MGLSATVLGASGYSGGELLRLLRGHPALGMVACAAERRAGQEVARAHPNLAGDDSIFASASEVAAMDADVCFSCLPSGALEPLGAIGARVVVDLSDEHRADDAWTYGLTEFARADVRAATRIANPGCYPTAVLLATVPFARAGALGSPVMVDAISGISGAGRKAEDRLLFATAADNVGAYGSTRHRHVPEMEKGISRLGGGDVTISFTPHLAPVARGLVVTVRAPLIGALSEDDATEVLRSAYASEPFVTVVEGWPASKSVAGSNHAHVAARVDDRAGILIASVAIDNLGKGAAGQALQNANLALGVDEDAGLAGVGIWP